MPPLEDPRSVLRRHGLYAKRSWGQNFLINLPLVERIADAVTDRAERIIEIGAGAGTLTSALAARAPEVIAIERDPEMLALLQAERLEWGDHVQIVGADAAHFDYASAAEGAATALAGNLPYQITGRLLRSIVGARSALREAVIMVQLEVAERLRAGPGSKTYGVMGVMCQAWFDVELLWRVSPGSFHPRPKVASAVVRLRPQDRPRAGDLDEPTLSRVVHAAFGARRKTLRNALSSAYPRDAVESALAAASIDPGRRGETLQVEQLAELARALESAPVAPELP